MKRVFKVSSLVLSLLLLVGTSACAGGGRGKSDPNTLYIGNYDGGLGDEWLKTVAEKFIEQNPSVKIEIDNEKDRFGDTSLLNSMPNFRQDVYFLNQITYSSYVKAGVLADITDVVTNKREETRIHGGESVTESVSIEEKMTDVHKAYYKTTDNQYFAIPFAESIFGAVYDVDLFEQKRYYFKDGYTSLDDPFIRSLDNKRTAGADGEYGTGDDGLPATYDEMYALMDRMKLDSVTPYMWNGMYQLYRERYLTTLWADFEGIDNFNLNSTFSGSYQFEGDSAPTTITNANAYLLQKQTGKKVAVEFAERLIRGKYYRTDSFGTTQSHLMAQSEYLYSRYRNQPVAIILEGGWWENEARNTFKTMQESYNSTDSKWGYGERRFAFLPTPKYDASRIDGRRTMLSASGGSVACINNKTDKLELAKKFLAFAHTDESLRIFTTTTGVPRPFDYELSEADREKMTHFALDMWDTYRDENTDIVYNSISMNTMKSTEKSYFSTWAFGATNIGGVDYDEPFLAFHTLGSITAQNYLEGMQRKYSEKTWNTNLANYL